MHYGQYSGATLIYTARDTGELFVLNLRYQNHIAERMVLKATTILEAVYHRLPPHCECGRWNSKENENGRND